MDELAEKNQKTKVLFEKLNNATQAKSNLKEERSLIKGCISEVNDYLQQIIETRDSSFTVSIRQSFSEKLQPVFAMLNQIIGVSGSSAPSKQGWDKDQHPKTETDHKGNEASASKKGNGKEIDDDEEEEELSKYEKLVRKIRDTELDDLHALQKKLEVEEGQAKNAEIMLETQKSLFPS